MKNYIIPGNQKKLRKMAIEKREVWSQKKHLMKDLPDNKYELSKNEKYIILKKRD